MNNKNDGLPEELLDLRDSKTRLTYLKGENLFKQGAFAPYVIFIIDGLVKIYLETGLQKQVNLRIAGSGEFLALSAVFDESHYMASSVALKDTLVCMVDKKSFGKLLQQHTDFAMRIMAQNFKSENRLVNIIGSLSYNQMRGKLASALVYLSSGEFGEENIFQFLSRQDIADFASVSLESTVKFLKEFEKEGIIKLEGRHISIVHHSKLKEITELG